MANSFSIDQIDDLLPQTQCGLCGYGSCRPYAEALVNHDETINRCPPGGAQTLLKLAAALNKDPTPYLKEMEEKAKPLQQAIIRESECIGCTKCIQACPVDAIVGAAKQMHTIISQICTGCELCLPPCPVDCIEMILAEPFSELERKEKAASWRSRYHARQKRLATSDTEKADQAKINDKDQRKIEINAAIQRALKKNPSYEC